MDFYIASFLQRSQIKARSNYICLLNFSSILFSHVLLSKFLEIINIYITLTSHKIYECNTHDTWLYDIENENQQTQCLQTGKDSKTFYLQPK